MTMNPPQVVCFGEILWDILPSGAKPGGAPMNVAYHLQKLGVAATLISKIGDDEWGRKLLKTLEQNGLQTACLQMDKQQPTGLVNATPNEEHEMSYDIVFPSAWDFIEWQDGFEALVTQSGYFVFGSLAYRHQTSKNTLNRLLQKAGKKVLDINLRPPHFNQYDIEYLISQADILKVNSHELDLITSWFGQFETMTDRIACLHEHFQLETIIVTRGGAGAVVSHRGELYEHDGFKVTVADTVGSGDAFLAGFLASLLQKKPVKEALHFASGLGAFIASQPGACPAYQLSDVQQVMKH